MKPKGRIARSFCGPSTNVSHTASLNWTDATKVDSCTSRFCTTLSVSDKTMSAESLASEMVALASNSFRSLFVGSSDFTCLLQVAENDEKSANRRRSGAGAESTKYTDGSTPQALADGSNTTSYKPGGSAWTPNFLVFDNSYYKITKEAVESTADADLLSLSTDKVIFVDPLFKPFAEKFAASQEDFFAAYATAHKKLSEQGSKFEPVEGISL